MTGARRGELTETAMDAAIERACTMLRLPTVRDRYGEVAGIASRQQASCKGFLTELLSLECDDRETRRKARLVREAGFPRPKRLEDFGFAANPDVPAALIGTLARCQWVAAGQPLCLIGDSGTGKSHLLTGLGTAAAENGYRVRYVTAAALVNELAEAADDRMLTRVIARYGRIDLLCLDELGYIELDRRGAELLFQVFTEREEKNSVAIASNAASSMVDNRARRRMPPHGRTGEAVVAAMRKAIGEAAEDSTRTAAFVFRRTREILAEEDGDGPAALPSESTLYRLFARLEAGRHTTGSARTRRSLGARPEGPFGQVPAAAPGDVMQIDSTPLDVLVRLDNGVTGRVDLTGIIDVATRTVTAAVLRPTTKSVDASVLLARTVTPEPMRPGWPQAMRMSESALPFRRLLSIGERLEHAAARPVIIPQVIVVDHGKVFVSESFRASCAFLGISFQPARKATGTDKPHIERMPGSVATMFAQYVSGYTGRSPEYRGRSVEDKAVWSLPELQDLLGQWLIIWPARPHDGLRDPLHPGRAFSPDEKYAALTETAGYVPLALSPEDYIELLPAAWRAVNAYGIKISRRVYDGKELNPLRMQHSGVTARKGLHEVHHDPYDISRIWVRDHRNGGWITVFWTQLHRVAAPFGELAWDHAGKLMPGATEAGLADAVEDLLTRAGQGPGGAPAGPAAKRERRVVARTRAAGPSVPSVPGPGDEPAAGEAGNGEGDGDAIVPMPIFDPFREAEKWR